MLKEELQNGSVEALRARRTKNKTLEYEVKLWDKSESENEWWTIERLAAEGCEVLARRFDEQVAAVEAGIDRRALTTTEIQDHLTEFGLDPSFGE